VTPGRLEKAGNRLMRYTISGITYVHEDGTKTLRLEEPYPIPDGASDEVVHAPWRTAVLLESLRLLSLPAAGQEAWGDEYSVDHDAITMLFADHYLRLSGAGAIAS
jgi:hypothetical protein